MAVTCTCVCRILIIFAACITFQALYSYAQSIEDTVQLMSDLFYNNTFTYSTHVRPIRNQSRAIQVGFMFVLNVLAHYDIAIGSLEVSGFTKMTWKDEQLTWNSSQYGGISVLAPHADQIWLPSVIADISSDILHSKSATILLTSDGVVTWYSTGLFKLTCLANLLMYPVDTHKCLIRFTSNKDMSHHLHLAPIDQGLDALPFTESAEWSIYRADCKSEQLSNGPATTTAMGCTLGIKRRPEFVIFHVTMPVLFVTLLNLVVFWVPLQAGERITLSVTVFLAFTVFTSDITEEIPRNSLQITFYSIYLLVCNAGSAMGVIISVILIRISSKMTSPIPRHLVTLTRLVYASRGIPLKVGPSTERKSDKGKENKGPTNLSLCDEELKETPEIPSLRQPDASIVSWEMVAQAIDYTAFLVYLTIHIIFTTTYLVLLQFYDYK